MISPFLANVYLTQKAADRDIGPGFGFEAKGHAMAKNTICLWYDKDAEAAARFYAETFPDSAVGVVHRAPSDYPSGKKADVLTVEFTYVDGPLLARVGESAETILEPSVFDRNPQTTEALLEQLLIR